jgi:hypothetical protein
MTKQQKQKLLDAGRYDLIEIYELLKSGNAAIINNGNIVDVRKYPDSIPIKAKQ